MQYASGYWSSKSACRVAVSAFARRCVAFPGVRPGMRLLEVGCGYGADAVFFARRGLRVTGLDFSQTGVERTTARARAAGVGLRVLQHDVTQTLPFGDRSFDVVYAHLSLHYFDDATTRRVVADVLRVLADGGLFFLKCKSVDDPLYGKGEEVGPDTFRTDHVRHFFSREYMQDVLGDVQLLRLRRTAASYDGHRSTFVEAVGRKAVLNLPSPRAV